MAWLEAVTYLATLTYKFFRGDSEERGERRRRREEYYDSYSTEWNSQDPYGPQQFDPVYGDGVDYYEQSVHGSEKRRHGEPQEEEWYSYRIQEQNGDTEIDVVGRQRVGKKKRRGFSVCRRVDYEERGTIRKKYVDRRGRQVIDQQKPAYRSRMYEENQYLPTIVDDGEGIERDADAGISELVHREHRKRW